MNTLTFKTEPWRHQVEAINMGLRHTGFGIFLDMGTGKTKVAIDIMVNRGHQRILTVAPKRALDVWPRQVAEHSNGYTVVNFKNVPKKKIVEVLKEGRDDIKIMYVMNYEVTWQEPVKSALKKMKFDLIILDEAHRIKGPGSKTSKNMAILGKTIPWRLALTGTPTPQSPLDAYAMYRFLDPSIFGTRYSDFKSRYCIENPFNYQKEYINQGEQHEKMYSIAYRVLSEDVLELPEVVEQNYKVELQYETMQIYKQLRRESVLVVDGELVPINNVLAQYTRMHQLTSGVVPDGKGTKIIDTSKRDMFADVLSDLPIHEPVVVFAKFVVDLDNIKEVCRVQKRRYSEVSGRIDQLKEWQSGATDVVAVQIQSGAEAEDYTRSHYGIYYSLGFNLKDYLQSRKRLDRPGQTRHPVFIHLLAKGTIDIQIMEAIKSGKQIIDYLNDDLRKGV